MKCPSCNQEIAENSTCSQCGYEVSTQARPMSREEIEHFDGITIEEQPKSKTESKSESGNYREHESQNSRIYVRQISPGNMVIGLLIMVMVVAGLFILLPTLFLLGLAVAAVVFLFKLFA